MKANELIAKIQELQASSSDKDHDVVIGCNFLDEPINICLVWENDDGQIEIDEV